MSPALSTARRIKNAVHFAVQGSGQMTVTWKRRGTGWLENHLDKPTIPKAQKKLLIEDLAWRTEQQGEKPLAREYGQPGAKRSPAQVRSSPVMGDVFAWLAEQRRPQIVVEFGSAFG